MKFVFLVINYMPHQLVSIRSVLKIPGTEIHAFNFKDPHTIPQGIDQLYTYELRNFSRAELLSKILAINPEGLVVAGWAVKDYVWVAKEIRSRLKIPVVSYSDTQWRGTWRQRINCMLSPWHVKKAFSHLWVAGLYQYEYARKLGFAKSQIVYNSLSCDVRLFRQVSVEQKQTNYPKNFLFIGRFVPVKGLDLLLEAWQQISNKNGWTLTLVGDGVLKKQFTDCQGVIVKHFMSQKELIKEMEKAGCFVLPSVFEPWALVIHEAAAAGLPIIATDVCGAVPHFVVSGYNGFQVQPKVGSIKHALEQVIQMDTEQLVQFGRNSEKLAESISPERGAAQLFSVLQNESAS
ncbi:glycosyltransferase [uncultured Sunxiuqinia sp.]|uniref:glycosyltransferase family 4 protein n=1 Tax=uncultured Sunxiuqinia sp. TaxID=1573825 RepID=UPI002604B520|nr:glycosyltransferase [uncultured Sunxiuqinia sp.]